MIHDRSIHLCVVQISYETICLFGTGTLVAMANKPAGLNYEEPPMQTRTHDAFSIDCDTSVPGMAMLRFKGSLDAHTYELAEEEFERLFEMGSWRIAVDASALDYISSAGIGVLIGALARVRSENGNLLLVNATQAVRDVLSVLGLEAMFFNAPDRITALAFLNRQ
jgi:anti-anti-sigma factor